MVSYREEEKTVETDLSDRYLNLNFILLLQADSYQNMALADMIP